MSAPASLAFEGRFMDQELYRQQAHRGRAIWRIGGQSAHQEASGSRRHLAGVAACRTTCTASGALTDREAATHEEARAGSRSTATRATAPDSRRAPAGTSAAPYPAGAMLEMQRQGAREKRTTGWERRPSGRKSLRRERERRQAVPTPALRPISNSVRAPALPANTACGSARTPRLGRPRPCRYSRKPE